jgi:hemoglobin
MSNLLTRIGGADGIAAVFNRFYDLAWGDRDLLPFFAGVDVERLVARQVDFLVGAWGGEKFRGPTLPAAHAHMKISPRHYEKMLQYVDAAIVELSLAEDVRRDVLDYLRSIGPEIVNSD